MRSLGIETMSADRATFADETEARVWAQFASEALQALLRLTGDGPPPRVPITVQAGQWADDLLEEYRARWSAPE